MRVSAEAESCDVTFLGKDGKLDAWTSSDWVERMLLAALQQKRNVTYLDLAETTHEIKRCKVHSFENE
jgi:hypothetical protein